MKISFRVQRHAIRDAQAVEIWCDGEFIGSLYGLQDECGVKIVSKYTPCAADGHDTGRGSVDFPPPLEVRFKK